MRKAISLVIMLLMSISFIQKVSAEENINQKTIKVGFYAHDGYHMIDDNGSRSGYGYDYLQKLLNYTDWKYEYIGYDKSWTEMQQMLEDGEIDILTQAAKTDKRLQKFAFSEIPIGSSTTIFTVKAGNSKYSTGNFSSMDGIRVGMLRGSDRNDSLDNFAKQKGFTYNIVYFDSYADMKKELQEGQKIDAIVSSNLRSVKNESVVAEFDLVPFYVMVSKENVDLLDEVNGAISSLTIQEPQIQKTLNDKYFTHYVADEIQFSTEEIAYLDSVANKTFSVLINPDRYPLSYVENGQMMGVIAEIADKLFQKLGIKYEYIITSTQEQYNEVLKGGKADICFDMRLDYGYAENVNYNLTKDYLSANLFQIARKDSTGDIQTVAAIKDSDAYFKYIKPNYNEAEIIYFDTISECIEAVDDKIADATFQYLYSARLYMNNGYNISLKSELIPKQTMNFTVAVNGNNSKLFNSIIDKGLSSLLDEDITSAILKNSAAYSITTQEILYKYRFTLLGSAIIIISIFCIFQYKKNRDLYKFAYFDRLTGCPNQAKFHKDVSNILHLNPNKTFSCIIFDIHNFKFINEYYGYQIGDKVLISVSNLLQLFIDTEPVDTAAYARIHSDIFALFVETNRNSEEKLESVISVFRNEVNYIDDYKLDICLGRYISNSQETSESIIEKALIAHSYAGDRISNTFTDYNSLDLDRYKEEVNIRNRFEDALKNDEFEVYLQPQYNIDDDSIVGAESLVRWIIDGKVRYYPDMFISVLENTGFIIDLDLYMFEKSCEILSFCIENGKKVVPISVNFSKRHLEYDGLAAKLSNICDKYNLSPSLLVVEVTESMMHKDVEAFDNMIEDLEGHGFAVAVDDFGIGYSSLSLLKNSKISCVKLDRSFFEGDSSNEKSKILLAGLVTTMKEMGISTLAEGIESQEQIELIKGIGCQKVQGYYYAKPMPVLDFYRLIDNKEIAKN